MFRFTKLSKEHLETVMAWRVKPEVSEYLITDVKYNLENQRCWFKKIESDDTCKYWLIHYGDVPIGVFNLAAIDHTCQRCSAGYYIGEMDYRQLGALIPPYIYNYVFRKMKFRKIYGEVIAGNINVLKMHKLHGFREVGVYRDHFKKKGQFLDAVLIELLSEDWLKQKKYERFVPRFE